jgi:DNA-binding LytR/AlgR family response regulator
MNLKHPLSKMSDNITCLIIDDEPIARDILQTYCGHLSNIQVIASCGNALEAKTILQNQPIDMLLLDINMPVLDGISFLKTLKNPPQVIFITAYKEFAIDAFDLSACDYLLKPFSLERFIIAVDKVRERLNAIKASNLPTNEPNIDDFIFVKSEGKIYKIAFNDLLFAEAKGNNTKIVLKHTTLLPAMTFTNFEELLPKSKFFRLHRSFIINKSKITHLEGNRVFIHEKEIPIGSHYKEDFLKDLGV